MGIDAELNAAPWMPSVTRASCMTNVAANCSKRHRSADGYRTARSHARSNCACICKCKRSPSAEIDHHRDNPRRGDVQGSHRPHAPHRSRPGDIRWTNAFGAGNGVQFATERRRGYPSRSTCRAGVSSSTGSWRRTGRKAPWLGHVDRIAGLRAGDKTGQGGSGSPVARGWSCLVSCWGTSTRRQLPSPITSSQGPQPNFIGWSGRRPDRPPARSSRRARTGQKGVSGAPGRERVRAGQQHASRARRSTRVPAITWGAILSHIRDPTDAARLADSARNRLLYRHATDGYDAGRLADLLAKQGRGEERSGCAGLA